MLKLHVCADLKVVQPPPHLEVLEVFTGEYGMVSQILAQNYRTLKHLTLIQLKGDIADFRLDFKMESKPGVVV